MSDPQSSPKSDVVAGNAAVPKSDVVAESVAAPKREVAAPMSDQDLEAVAGGIRAVHGPAPVDPCTPAAAPAYCGTINF